MKAMSKFFLIFSGIVVLIGVIICLIASGIAKAQGILLFPEKIDGRYIYTVDLTDTEINKITVDVTDADITVITGQENEYVEFINFNENYYSISTTNHVLSFDEYVDFKSMITFWDSDYSFKGIRSLVRLGNKVEGEKQINIYISNDRDVNVFDLSVGKGDIEISHLSTETDYKFSVDNGTISMTDISTVSNVSVNANTCNIKLEDCSFSSFECDAADITLNGSISFCHTFTVNSKNGTVNSDVYLDSDEFEVAIITEGNLTVNNESQIGSFKNDQNVKELPEDHTTVKVTGEMLNVSLNYRSLSESTVIDKEQ